MILKASQRGASTAMGAHLLNTTENEHVEIHEIRGFVAEDIMGAMKEAQALARGTRCKQHLFSVSLSPPETENVPTSVFEKAVEQIEKAHGLDRQPRVVVFHEKEGRRHAHCVWSRIDAETMTARPLPHFKLKLREISKDLYLENGWRLPRGLVNSAERDPRNFTLAEWQQAKRQGRDPRHLKGVIQDCCAISDSREAFASALEARGLHLAKGDRRGHVAVTYEGEVLAIARMVGRPAKEIAARLGNPDQLRSVEQTRNHIARVIAPKMRDLIAEADRMKSRAMKPLVERRDIMKNAHRTEREKLDRGQASRQQVEMKDRAARMRGGIPGLWDRLNGTYARTKAQNEVEALQSFTRDRAQRDDLRAAQLKDRRDLQRDIRQVRHRHATIVLGLHRDLARQERSDASRDADRLRGAFRASAEGRPSSGRTGHQPSRSPRGPGLDR